VTHPFEHVVEEDRVRFPSVRAPQDNEVSLLDLAIRTRTTTSTKNSRQTGDAGGMSGAITTVNVIAPHDDTGELLRHEIHLVAGLRATKQPERLWPALGDGGLKAIRRPG
jgi:hypothetical protein